VLVGIKLSLSVGEPLLDGVGVALTASLPEQVGLCVLVGEPLLDGVGLRVTVGHGVLGAQKGWKALAYHAPSVGVPEEYQTSVPIVVGQSNPSNQHSIKTSSPGT
jgi:hypothetical protein